MTVGRWIGKIILLQSVTTQFHRRFLYTLFRITKCDEAILYLTHMQ